LKFRLSVASRVHTASLDHSLLIGLIVLSMADISTNDPSFGPPLYIYMLSFHCSPASACYVVAVP